MPDLLERLKSGLADRYAVETEIGRGGMAVVFLAEDLKHHRKVAIKVLHPDLTASLAARRFLEEIEITARLDHPHVVALYDSGQADGLLYYVMPYVEGESLRERLERLGQLPVEEAVRIAAEITDGLSYAHGRGVVHRDVKPANILISTEHARIADFGIARAIDVAAEDRATATGLAVGTPMYMAPEQATGDGGGDERSDIYAVGCLLYEMLVGEPPYSGSTPQVVQARKLTDRAPSIRSIRDTVPPVLDGVVAKALARIPADRYQTVCDLKSALTADTAATPEASPAAPRSWTRTLAIGVATVMLLALVGYGIRAAVGESETVELRSVAVLPLDLLSEQVDGEYVAAVVTEDLINDLARLDAFEKVSSRTSVMKYAETDLTLPEIADDLGVEGVIEGSVRWEGDSVRLNFTLMHGPSERRLWSGDFAGGKGELLALQRRVVRQVVDGIDLAVSPVARDRLDRPPYDPDPGAYEAYVKGRYHAGLYNVAGAKRATDHFLQAVELDSGFVLARAALAENRCVLYWALMIEPTPTAEECEEMSRNAIASDPTLAEAHSVLAMAKIRNWEWKEAEAAFRRALDLNPNALLPRTWYGWFLTEVGRPNEGLVEARRAEALAPVELFTKTLVAQPLMNMHRYEEALAQMDSVVRLDPDYGAAFIYRAHIYALMGEPELSREATNRVVQAFGDDFPQALALYAWSYALEGDESRALELLAELEALHEAFVRWPAVVYLQLGREDEALDALERSYESREEFLPNLLSSPHLDSIRDHPRFRALREKIGLAGV